MPRKPRKPPTDDEIDAMGPDDDFAGALAETYRGCRDRMRADGVPEHAIQKAIRADMIAGLFVAFGQAPEKATVGTALAAVMELFTPAFLILFPPAKPEDN